MPCCWEILQLGAIPLSARGERDTTLEHRPTSVLIWPEGEAPSRSNCVLTDPYFTPNGLADARRVLARLGASWADVERLFVTHCHFDHMPRFPGEPAGSRFTVFTPDATTPWLETVACTGHSPDLDALAFQSAGDGAVWVVGDAVLDEEWLRAWNYYWPNGYGHDQIVQHWRDVATVLSQADVIVPGHGAPIRVTPELVQDLLTDLPQAQFAEECPDVAEALRARVAQGG